MKKGNGTKNQSGYTLIELIISIAILAVIGVAISSIIVFAAKQYKRTSIETLLSQQAQNTVNQLNQMIMDAPDKIVYAYKNSDDVFVPVECEAFVEAAYAESDRRLQIVNGDTVLKTVIFSKEENKLYYCEGDKEEQMQVLAECVDSFEMDTTDFENNRTATISLSFETEGKFFQTSAQVTSRNEVPGELVEIEEKPEFVIQPKEVILEPNQDFNVNVKLIGSTEGFRVSSADYVDSDTKITPKADSLQIHIGRNEKGDSKGVIHVSIVANEEKDGQPVATARLTVKIRRVNDISANMTLINGSSGKAGAIYSVKISVIGTNLDKAVGMLWDEDYVDPRKLTYVESYSIHGNAAVSSDYFQVLDHTQENPARLTIKLKKDLAADSLYEVRFFARHPMQKESETLYYNKTGLEYDSIATAVTLSKKGEDLKVDLNFKRSDDINFGVNKDKEFGNVYQGNTFNDVVNNSDYRHWFFRFREVKEDGYGPWSPIKVTNYGSNQVLQRKETVLFEPDKYYQIQMIYAVISKPESQDKYFYFPVVYNYREEFPEFGSYQEGWKKYGLNPAETPKSEYLWNYGMPPVDLFMNAYIWRNGQNIEIKDVKHVGTATEPFVMKKGENLTVNMYSHYAKMDSLKLSGIMEKWDNASGRWVESDNWVQIDNSGVKIYNQNHTGRYRIKMYSKDWQTYHVTGGIFETNYDDYKAELKDFPLYNETTGDGIIYYEVTE